MYDQDFSSPFLATDETLQEENDLKQEDEFKTEDFDEEQNHVPPVQEKKYNQKSSHNKRKQKLQVLRHDDFEIEELKPIINEILYCQFCEYGADLKNLKNHLLNHFKDSLFQLLPTSIPFSCPECQVPHRDKITLLRHYGWKHSIIYKFASNEDLKPRQKDQPIRDLESAKPEIKSECGDSLTTERKVENGAKKNHKCETCGRLFSNVKSLNKHISRLPKNHKDNKCEFCNKSFFTKEGLRLHKRSIHEGRRDFRCEICDKLFLGVGDLKKHIHTVHEGYKNYKCESCGKLFSLAHGLKGHINTVHKGHKD